MNVDVRTIEGLDSFLKEHLEADIITELARQRNLSPNEAMELFFGSRVATGIEEGSYGIQYLSARYLAEEVLKNLHSK